MATITDNLRMRFRRSDMAVQLVWVNVGIYVLVTVASVVLMLFNRSLVGLVEWVELPASPAQLVRQPWSVLTYMFMHGGLLHLVFNVLWLYGFGRLFLQFFSARHLLGLYLLGGLAGGVLYVVAYNVFPYFQSAVHYSYLVGASASVLAIVCATAYREPDYPLRLMLLGTIRLKWLALAAIVLDLMLMSSGNAGGHIAHLGGALAGLAFAAGLRRGRDLTKWINAVISGLMRLTHRRGRPRMKVRWGGQTADADRSASGRHKAGRRGQKKSSTQTADADRQSDYDYNARQRQRQAEIDRILDKIKAKGYGGLTEEEKKTLFDASQR